MAAATIIPVLFMIGLGVVSKEKQWINWQQKEGANSFVFTILFPIMIFHILFTATIQLSGLFIVLYVFVSFCIVFWIGKLLASFLGERFSHIAKYMLPTVEGGSVALPLYISIVGNSSNTVIFDLAGIIFAFIVLPILVTRETTSGIDNDSSLIKTIFTNSFVIAVILGLGGNILDLHTLLSNSSLYPIYTGIMDKVTTPIVGTILFIIGYNLKFNLETIEDVLKLVSLRIALYTVVIIGFFVIFPSLMAEKEFLIAVILYFMCPTGFAIPIQIAPLYKNEDDSGFTSAIISLNMIFVLIVYAILVIFVS